MYPFSHSVQSSGLVIKYKEFHTTEEMGKLSELLLADGLVLVWSCMQDGLIGRV